MEPAYVGLGANLGEPLARVSWAEAELASLPGVARVRLSSMWRSAPVGPVADQPWFVNAVAELSFHRWDAPHPVALLAALLAIEARAGRERSREIPQGPRPLDLDLLVWGRLRLDDPGPPPLRLPHPRLAVRAFALAPLVELAGPGLEVPGAGRAGALLAAVLRDPSQSVAKIV